MTLGGSLLVEALPALAAGTLQPRPQPAQGVSHAPVPGPADWTMMSSLPAAWAWRFARGVAPLGGPLTAIAGGTAIRVADALDWSPDERLPERVWTMAMARCGCAFRRAGCASAASSLRSVTRSVSS